MQTFGRQLLHAVAFLHTLKLVHTDLKPENILLLSSAYQRVPVSSGSKFTKRVPMDSTIRLIDFGSATFENQYHSTVVSTITEPRRSSLGWDGRTPVMFGVWVAF